MMRHAIDQMKRSRNDVHFPISDHQVAVASESLDVFVLVLVFVIGIQEIAVAQHKIDDRVAVAVRLFWVSAEDVINRTSVVEAGGNLTVGVEVCIPPRIREALQLKAFNVFDQLEIRVAVSAALVV